MENQRRFLNRSLQADMDTLFAEEAFGQALASNSEDMREGITKNFKGFKAIADDGTLIGPWTPWLRTPKFGGPVWFENKRK